MHPLVENNKGFTTLEVIVVLCIVGILSAISFPRILDWNKARAVQSDVLKAFNVFDNINSQVQRGLYAFVQVYIIYEDSEDTGTALTITSRGITADTLGDRITSGAFRNAAERCSRDVADWDHDGSISDRPEVSSVVLNNLQTTLADEDEAGVCFSKDGRWYSTTDELDGENSLELFGTGGICDRHLSPRDEMDIRRGPQCEYRIIWSRFGNIKVEKWAEVKGDWVTQ